MQKVVCRASAKVPIVKCWDPDLRLACDLNVNNPLALENTRMIKTYVQLDDRVRPLAKIIKYWTKRRILNDAGKCSHLSECNAILIEHTAFGGTISSYTWTCMIISFLQRRTPPIVPSLQKVEGKRRNPGSQFADDVEALRGYGNANKESLPQLLFQFFRHYGYEFEYDKNVVSVKEGRLLSRKEKGWDWSNFREKEGQKKLCVEEPFTVNRNLGNSADEYAWHGVHSEIRRAFQLLADGQQLEKCCEQYEFPPEEKREPLFQKPPPKPAPTLRRSASQSGRSNHEQGSGRSRKSNNRNQSSQRSGNRRASSGASFSNQRVPLPFSPQTIGSTHLDYFAAKGNLHDQLYQQYQYLQAQQDALRSQLAQHAQQQHQQNQGQSQRVSDLNGSPHSRAGYANGTASPRYLEPLPTAPLLTGYLYHYPARYPPPSPMQQTRSREGTITNPSSPSLVSVLPRRQIHRASMPEGSSGSVRSQSQPGRSLPHPLTLQQQVHPGYDVSGVLPTPYQNVRSASHAYAQTQASLPPMFSPVTAMPSTSSANENTLPAIPKEYIGYYVGQSPSLGPQPQYATTPIQMPAMTLGDPPPQRQRRVTPDLMPPMPNGRHSSRSPSPLGHLRSYSTTADLRSKSQADMLLSPTSYDTPVLASFPPPPRLQVDSGGPLIVNGSNTTAEKEQSEEPIDNLAPACDALTNGTQEKDIGQVRSLPLRVGNMGPKEVTERVEPGDQIPPPTNLSSPRRKAGSIFALSPNGVPQSLNGMPEKFHEPTQSSAPLLSPVAELRTPSPTQAHAFDKQESPQANGLMRAANIANAKQAENGDSVRPVLIHERKGSAPIPTTPSKPAKSPMLPTSSSAGSGANGLSTASNPNPWQQATRKSHKKSKSSANARAIQGQVMPTHDVERKGG